MPPLPSRQISHNDANRTARRGQTYLQRKQIKRRSTRCYRFSGAGRLELCNAGRDSVVRFDNGIHVVVPSSSMLT